MRAPRSEKEALRLWREEATRTPLWTETGERLRVLYPGRRSAGAGPDFRDALLLLEDGTLLRGDVEVHLRARDWHAHGHARDPRYRNIVLHAVFSPARRGAGEGAPSPPLVVLFPLLKRESGGPAPRLFLLPPSAPLGKSLEKAGDAWFRGKVRAFARRLREGPAEEVLYQGLMEALGYKENRGPFLALAEGLPLSFLRRALQGSGPEDRPLSLWALLAGSTGLLHREGTPLLRAQWERWGMSPVLSDQEWALFRLRPANHPFRRLAGMALLLHRFWEEGLQEGLAGALREGRPALERALTIPVPEGWGEVLPGARPRRLIGPQRAGEMAVNIVLPFFCAWGRLRGDEALARQAGVLFRSWPPLEENELVREALSLLPPGAGEALTSARRQQGLLLLYRRALGPPGTPVPRPPRARGRWAPAG